MDTLISSINGTAPVPKAPPGYTRNTGQVDSDLIIDYISTVGAKKYRYETDILSLIKFGHTTSKVLDITTIKVRMGIQHRIHH